MKLNEHVNHVVLTMYLMMNDFSQTHKVLAIFQETTIAQSPSYEGGVGVQLRTVASWAPFSLLTAFAVAQVVCACNPSTQEAEQDCEFTAIMSYIVRPCQTIKTKQDYISYLYTQWLKSRSLQ